MLSRTALVSQPSSTCGSRWCSSCRTKQLHASRISEVHAATELADEINLIGVDVEEGGFVPYRSKKACNDLAEPSVAGDDDGVGLVHGVRGAVVALCAR